MNGRERITRALRGELTDRLARGEFFIADDFTRAFRTLDADAPIAWEQQRAVIAQLDLDIAPVAFSEGWGALEQPDADRALEHVARWRAAESHFIVAVMDGPFSAAIRQHGFNETMHAIHGAPELAREWFQRGAEDARVIARAIRDAGADGVVLGEDIAYGSQTYIAPAQLRELYWQAVAWLAREIRAAGLAVFYHSDGNLNAVLDDLVACGLDGLQGLEPGAGMDVVATRARVGAALTLWGNLSFDFLSAPRADDDIRALIARLSGDGRRFILGSCGGLVAGMNVATVREVYRVAKKNWGD
ncbi:MAG: hypothetical protein HY868_08470 [Chloroflexi bacterium]|nr:hypothetical protein [Chloroflexota bacterium]